VGTRAAGRSIRQPSSTALLSVTESYADSQCHSSSPSRVHTLSICIVASTSTCDRVERPSARSLNNALESFQKRQTKLRSLRGGVLRRRCIVVQSGRVGGGRVKRKYKGASMSTHGTSARLLRAAHPKDTVHCRRRASSLPFSTCLTVSEEESRLYNSQYPSFPTTSFSIAESKNNALQASNRVIETDASITTVTLGSLPLHPHGRHPFRLSTFRGDQTPRIYVHPTEGASRAWT